ncbi:MAG: hypothetical protein FJ038_12760, partial [Chloroflexi bacterium]|nr:hypothetical protein [Chloroflexota bacterium]
MIPAVIEFSFDPAFRLGDIAVRWETLALAFIIVVCVGLAAVIAGRTPAVNQAYPEMGGRERGAWHLRRDDLIYILLAVVPAAVLGGRLGYILIHWDFYSEHLDAWFDPTQGSLELSLAVVFGLMAGYAVAAGLGAPAGRWLHIATVPTLLGLTLGKFVGVLGGSGQGAASTVDWATAYQGAGPWGSLDPATPAHPSQLYEAVLSLLVLGLIVYLPRMGRFRDHDGRVFFAGISLWAIARVEAAFIWRDPEIFGPFRAAQVLALAIAITCFGLFALRAMYTGRTVRAILASRARVGRPATVPAASATGAAYEPAARPVMEPGLGAAPLAPLAEAGAGGGALLVEQAAAAAPAPSVAAMSPIDVPESAAADAVRAAAMAAEAEAHAAEMEARAAEEAAEVARIAAIRAAEDARMADEAAEALRLVAEAEAHEAMLPAEAEEAAALAAAEEIAAQDARERAAAARAAARALPPAA